MASITAVKGKKTPPGQFGFQPKVKAKGKPIKNAARMAPKIKPQAPMQSDGDGEQGYSRGGMVRGRKYC